MPSLANTLLLPLVLSLVPYVSSTPTGKGCSTGKVGSAVYIQTNEEKNSVVALPIGSDGRLSMGTVTATGGAGSVALGGNGMPVAADTLFSQSSLTVAGNALFVVNAGSNTLSMFSISEKNPTSLTLMGKPMTIPGDFPNTVAASLKNKLVCVATTGKRSGVSCSSFSMSMGLGPMDSLRSFNLNQTTPPMGPPNTVSQVLFSKDENSLYAMVKGDPGKPGTGFAATMKVSESCGAASLSMDMPHTSVISNTALLFGAALVPGDRIVVTDPSFGAAILETSGPMVGLKLSMKTTIPDQKATCWATYSSATGTAFVTDGGVNRLIELNVKDGSIASTLDLSSNGNPGLLDIEAAGNYIYALSPGNGAEVKPAVTVVDVSGGARSGKMIQNFSLSGMAGQRSMGLAVQMKRMK